MEVFYRVVKAGSFVKAERMINKSQPALSRSVAQLEERLNAKLLERHPRGVSLTRKGEEAFKIAQRMFMEMDSFKKSISEKEGMAGKIRISTTHAIAAYIIGPLLIDFAKEYKDIEIELLGNDTDIDIFHNEVDLAIRPYTHKDEELIQKPIFSLEAGLYASPEYIKKFGEPQSVKDLDHHQFLTFARSYANPYSDVEWSLRLGRKGKENRKPFYTSNNIENLLDACEKGLGIISFYEKMMKGREFNLVPILKGTKGPEIKFCILFPKSIEKVGKITEVCDMLTKKAGDFHPSLKP